MTEIHQDLSETTVNGEASRRWALHQRECPELAVHRILYLGASDVAEPYRRVRLRPSGSFVMVCDQGRGRILLDGRWQASRAGQACLAPRESSTHSMRSRACAGDSVGSATTSPPTSGHRGLAGARPV